MGDEFEDVVALQRLSASQIGKAKLLLVDDLAVPRDDRGYAGQLAGIIAELEFYGLGRSDIDDLYAKINAMTLADAQRVIKQYYPTDNLVFVVIGKASEIGEQVKKYAPKEDTLKITDPGFAVGRLAIGRFAVGTGQQAASK